MLVCLTCTRFISWIERFADLEGCFCIWSEEMQTRNTLRLLHHTLGCATWMLLNIVSSGSVSYDVCDWICNAWQACLASSSQRALSPALRRRPRQTQPSLAAGTVAWYIPLRERPIVPITPAAVAAYYIACSTLKLAD